MTILGSVVKAILVGYLSILAYVVYTRVYVPECKYLHLADLSRREKSCYGPLWALPDTRVDISIHVGKSLSNRHHAWSVLNHSIAEKVEANITFPVPDELSATDEHFYAWVLFHVTDSESDVQDKGYNFSLAEKRKVLKRRATRNLLESNTPADSSTETIPAENSRRRAAPAEEQRLHWKYAYAPAIVRHVRMHATLDAQTYYDTFAEPMMARPWIPSMTAGNMRKRTRKVYDPILWLDDLSITSRHYAPYGEQKSRSLIAASNNISNSSITALDGEAVFDKNISLVHVNQSILSAEVVKFEFQYVPTSVLYYFVKRCLQLCISAMQAVLDGNDEALDELRYYLSEDRLYTMIITQIIGWLHIIVEYMAFQDDWKFFRGRKNFKGVSSSSLIFSVFRSLIIFLYLHHQDTSWLVLGTLGKDIVYETWKLFKIFEPRFVWWSLSTGGAIGIPVNIHIRSLMTDGDEEEKKCAEYDNIASVHAGLCLYPLVIGMSVYYLKTYQYASWYSWFISSAVDCVYFFGFLAMLPQLYINYRLKSVAHLPVKSFMYKIFNTFLDDIFAFVVKMPLKHKIMTLRDDVVFFGFVYQWWIYPADKTRTNEFGFQYGDSSGESVSNQIPTTQLDTIAPVVMLSAEEAAR